MFQEHKIYAIILFVFLRVWRKRPGDRRNTSNTAHHRARTGLAPGSAPAMGKRGQPLEASDEPLGMGQRGSYASSSEEGIAASDSECAAKRLRPLGSLQATVPGECPICRMSFAMKCIQCQSGCRHDTPKCDLTFGTCGCAHARSSIAPRLPTPSTRTTCTGASSTRIVWCRGLRSARSVRCTTRRGSQHARASAPRSAPRELFCLCGPAWYVGSIGPHRARLYVSSVAHTHGRVVRVSTDL